MYAVQWAALYFCMAKIGKSTSLPQLYANGGRLILYLFSKSLSVYYHDDRFDTISDVALPVHFRCQFWQINAIESLFQHFRIKYFHVIIMLIEFRNTA